MKKRIPLWALLVSCVAFTAYTTAFILRQVRAWANHGLFHARPAGQVIIILLTVTITFLVLTLFNETLYELRKNSSQNGFVATRIAWLVGLVAANANAATLSSSSPTTQAVPITGSVSPVAAVSLLAHIERRRREQIREQHLPDKLTEPEMQQIHELRRTAIRSTHPCVVKSDSLTTHLPPDLVTAIERRSTRRATDVDELKWVVEVRVFGYPMVVSTDGSIAEFRKKRALELITWLSLNRDRARRSAARTAMWDIDISDSAFATVVSDMRRALRELQPSQDANSWLPATYSDDLPLNELVVTDVDRLDFAFRQFKKSGGRESVQLQDVLRGIRDVPFAGTSYGWADLDGTTTRLVITAIEICTEVSKTAAQLGNTELLTLAINAGLRVLPGCEELLELQNQHLLHTFARRPAK